MTKDKTDLPLVETTELKIHFPIRHGLSVKAVDGVDMKVRAGDTFGVIGESGSGKSTLGRALVGLVRPTAGSIHHRSVDSATVSRSARQSMRRDRQIIFQDPHAALNPRMRILDSVSEPLIIAGETRRAAEARAYAMLDRVGLEAHFAARYPHELSGGQKSRVNIARTLTLEPKLLVCDEIVAALDVSIQAEILNLLARLQRDMGLTYVFITHDLGVVGHVSDRIAVMYLGVFVEVGPAQRIVSRPLHPYTEALLSAEPEPYPSDLRRGERIILKGDIPSPVNPPAGCRFHTRCRYAREICARERPALREQEPGHEVACHFAGDLALAEQKHGPRTVTPQEGEA
ncbi:MAG TPA: oligopeptide/dipeptide ABC transporter ATP-binding protein [Rhodopila sp.]